MADKGYDGASMTEVAHAAGLTTGLIHYHFKNKREILLAAMQELAVEHDGNIAERLAQCLGDPVQEIAAFIDAHVGLGAHANPRALACWLVVGTEALKDAQVRETYAQVMDHFNRRLTRIIEAGIRRGTFTSTSPRAAASALMATIQGYYLVAATARHLIPDGTAAVCTKQMAEGLLKPTQSFVDGATP